MRRFITFTIAVGVVIGGLYAANAATSPDPVVRFRTASPDPIELDRLIGVFSDRVSTDPDSHVSNARLGELYLERAISTADLDDYARATAHLQVAAEQTLTSSVALALARSHLAQHAFADALETIESAGTDSVGALTIIFDAQLGLGALPEAERTLAHLEQLHPDEPVVIIRRAELSFLTGDLSTATDATERALANAEDADLGTWDLLFYRAAAARLQLLAGNPTRALELANAAAQLDQSDGGVLVLVARAQAATGDLELALATAERSASMNPDPATLGLLADLYLASDDDSRADRQLDTIEAIATLGQPALRRSTALALAEHDRSLGLALDMATAELSERDDPYAHHLMATVLEALGRVDEAERHIRQALIVADPVVWFRAGAIAHARGDGDLARERLSHALDLAPAFHPIYADAARDLLEEIGS